MADLPKKSIFYDFLERNNIETGRAKVYYSFTGAESGYTFPNNFSDASSFIDGSGLSNAAIPGISVGEDDEIYTSSVDSDGSGHFNGSGSVLLGKDVDYSGWTVFMQINDIGWLNTVTKPKILFGSMVADTYTSGFHIGIDGANHLYFEAPVDYTTRTTTLTCPKEVGGNILLSVSMGNQSSNLEISVHDVPYKENYTTKFSNIGDIGLGQATKTNASKDWRIGNFAYSPTYTSPHYSGYSGDIESFILISGFVSEEARNDLAKTFFLSEYVPAHEGITTTSEKIKTTTPYLSDAFTGSGVTGQDINLLNSYAYPGGGGGGTVKLYGVTDVLGPLSGQQLGFHESTETVTRSTTTLVEAAETYDTGVLYSGSKSTVAFVKQINTSDTAEVYSYITGTENHNLTPSIQGTEYEFLDHTGQKVNVYRNGLLQVEKSRNLFSTGLTVDYGQYGANGTGIVEIGPNEGIVSGQKYYVDFSYDYISGGVGSGSIGVSAGCLGAGESMAVITGNDSTAFGDEFGNVGEGQAGEKTVKTSGYVTASRDGLTILHSGADNSQISDANKIENNISFVDIRLAYDGDYEVSVGGNSIDSVFTPSDPGKTTSSVAFNATDTLIYDKMDHNNQSKFFVYTGQERADGLYGKDSGGKLDLKLYYLGETNTSDDEVLYEPYLNGKKMRSGEHYILKPLGAEPETMELDTTKFGGLSSATGLIQIAPLTSGTKNFNEEAATATNSYIEPSFKIVDEQVWLEGIRQKKNVQYEVVDASSKKKVGNRINNSSITKSMYSTNETNGGIGVE